MLPAPICSVLCPGLLLLVPSPFLLPSAFSPDLFLPLGVSGDLLSSGHVSQSEV